MTCPQRCAHDRPMLRSSAIVARSRSASASSSRDPAVDETAADVEQREQRNLAGLVGALRLPLLDLRATARSRRARRRLPAGPAARGRRPNARRSRPALCTAAYCRLARSTSASARPIAALVAGEDRDSTLDAGPELEPLARRCPLASRMPIKRQDPRSLPAGPLRRRLDADLRGAHVGPRRQRVLESSGCRRPHADGSIAAPDTGRSCSAGQVESEQRRPASDGRGSRSCSTARRTTCDARRIAARRPRFELADVAGAQARLGDVGQPLHEVGVLDRRAAAADRR